jgi:hypothetical protein
VKIAILLLSVLLPATLAYPQGRSMPVPAGVRQADQQQDQFYKNSVPPTYQLPSVDFAKLKHDAEELASLSQSIPPDIDQTTKGMYPKDLDQKLKRIEKLAKQLRSQVAH